MANIALTNRAMKTYIAPRLYEKMYTRIGTPQDTAGLVALLNKRPEIVPMIKILVLDEYHPCHARHLLSIKMSNLWCLLIQHEGHPVQDVGEREKRALNRNLVHQPSLRNFVFRVEFDRVRYELSKEDAALFRQLAVERFRLSNVDYSAFESVDRSYFAHPRLRELWTEILKLDWRHTRPSLVSECGGLDLTGFTALRLLRIQPGTLLGPGEEGFASYTTSDHPDLSEFIRSRLPPRLKVLVLEGLTNLPPPPGFDQLLCVMDVELIKCLIEQRQHVAPKLKYISMCYMDEIAEPTELYDLAEKHGMSLCGTNRHDYIDPPEKFLDED
ncbi:MAG: hypothetical protein LQ344_006835 [Seirophora lacunosa]|nr:MAG: hypothetical protein LQ344_006835 [Seirophora lacunosa]